MEIDSSIPFSSVMDLLLDAVCIVDADGRFVFVSAAGERVFGYPPGEMLNRPMLDFVHPEDRESTLQAASRVSAGNPLPHFENRYVRKDGRIAHIMWSAHWSEAHQMRIGVARDITERKRDESLQAALYAISEAAHDAEDLHALFREIHRIISGLMAAGSFTVALYDRSKDELKFAYHVAEPNLAAETHKTEVAALCTGLVRGGQATEPGQNAAGCLGVPLKTKHGVIGALAVKNPSADPGHAQRDTELLQFISTQIATAIERKQAEISLQHNAGHDPLTDLPNRELFNDRLQSALRLAQRSRTPLSLLYLDLDHFKQVNDTLGHAVGDLLLQEIAHRLAKCVRKSDTVARIGGDEFLVLLNNTILPEHAVLVAEKIRAVLNQPIEMAGHRLQVTPSVGIARYPEHGDDYKQLILLADGAMYDAKRRGGNQVKLADSHGIDGGGNPASA